MPEKGDILGLYSPAGGSELRERWGGGSLGEKYENKKETRKKQKRKKEKEK